MSNLARWALLVVIAGGIIAYLYLSQTSDILLPGPEQESLSEPVPIQQAESKISYPIEPLRDQFETPVAEQALPALSDSDTAMAAKLIELVGDAAFEQLFRSDNIVQRIVTTVDNLDRKKLAPKILPLQPTGGDFMVSGETGKVTIAEQNQQRYATYVILAEAVDTTSLVAAYSRYYPLFQEAFESLGYPDGYFNDRLVEVIDHLLAAPNVMPPVSLIKPEAFYLYADPDLETLSAGQKTLLRLGPDNSALVRLKLQEIRQAVSQPQAMQKNNKSRFE